MLCHYEHAASSAHSSGISKSSLVGLCSDDSFLTNASPNDFAYPGLVESNKA